jgi:hypothetical protein
MPLTRQSAAGNFADRIDLCLPIRRPFDQGAA